MNVREYQRLKYEAKEQYEAKIKALNTVWKMLQKPSTNGHAISKRDAIREAIKTIHGDFNMHRVREALKQVHPTVEPEISDNALSAVLSKLWELEELKQSRAKVGRTPARYLLPGGEGTQ